MRTSRQLLVFLILLFSAQLVLARSVLNEPDEGGIGGTGARPEPLEVIEPPEVPEIEDLIPDFEPDVIIIDDMDGVTSGADDMETPDDPEPEQPQD